MQFFLLFFSLFCLLVFIQDINPWFQFGHEGFTTPPATAHKGSCVYNAEQITCPLPPGCTHRVPLPVPKKGDFVGDTLCEEMPIRTRLGPLVAPPLAVKSNNNSNKKRSVLKT